MVGGLQGTFWSMLGVLVFRNSQEIPFPPPYSIAYTWLFFPQSFTLLAVMFFNVDSRQKWENLNIDLKNRTIVVTVSEVMKVCVVYDLSTCFLIEFFKFF